MVLENALAGGEREADKDIGARRVHSFDSAMEP